MKMKIFFAAIAFASILGRCVAAQAPGTTSKSTIPDAVTADGQHYTVEFENEYVRVLRIRYGPHEQGNMHDHPHSVTVFLTDGNLKMTFPDGKSRLGTVKKGSVIWEEAGPHQPQNVGKEPFEAVRIELKAQPAPK